MKRLLSALSLVAVLMLPIQAADWLHWRGPEQNGVARDTGLPSRWSKDGENLVWKQPYGGRSTPLVSRGRVYIINNAGEGVHEQERVMCLDAKTGKRRWEHRFNVFHTDIVSNRVGWSNLAGDPETGNIYAHGVQGLFLCFDPDGKVLWSKSLTEEYGRVTGYGGRVPSPIVDEDLVFINFLNSSWGDQGRGGHRFLALNKKTGEVVWWSEPGGPPTITTYSTPVVAVIKGQRLLICGGADGVLYAMKARTGEKAWSYPVSKRGIQTSPVVSGTLVYSTHSEENLDTNVQGAVVCVDASKIENGQPALVWREVGVLAGDPSPIVHEDRLYVCDKGAKLYCFGAKDGKLRWEYKYGTVAKGSPVWADGKIYVGEVSARFHILQPNDRECKPLHVTEFTRADGTVVELNGTPCVADGRVFFATHDEIYCIGTTEGSTPRPRPSPFRVEAAWQTHLAHLQLMPADIVLSPGENVSFKLEGYGSKGLSTGPFVSLEPDKVSWSLPSTAPPPNAPPGTPALPALKGEIKNGKLAVAKDVPAQAGVVVATFKSEGKEFVAQARVRVAPLLPIVQDFENTPEGRIPGGWINVGGKFVVETKDGSRVLKKLANNPSPPLARANAYIGMPNLSDYTIEADLLGTTKRRQMPDMGLINCRYSFVLDGNKQRLFIRSWEANRRLDKTIEFKWDANTWYRMKFEVTQAGDKALCRGKVWPRDQQEPSGWTIEVQDPCPNREGSPALYAYATGILETSPGTEIFFDNLKVTPNKSK